MWTTRACPGCGAGDIVIMDKLSSHEGSRTRALLEAASASILFLPPCSPDPDPIENAFARLEAMLRKAAARSLDALSAAIGRIVDTFTPAECASYVGACGYDPG